MDAETRSQIEDLTSLRDAHRARLRVLELQRARAGYSTAAEIETEIGTIEGQIRDIDWTINRLHIAEARWITRSIPPAGGTEFTTGNHRDDQLLAILRALETLQSAIHSEAGSIHRLLQTMVSDDSAERRRRQRLTDLFFIGIIVLLIALIFIILTR